MTNYTILTLYLFSINNLIFVTQEIQPTQWISTHLAGFRKISLFVLKYCLCWLLYLICSTPLYQQAIRRQLLSKVAIVLVILLLTCCCLVLT